MEMIQLRVVNYKGLREVQIPLSRFGCLIGENNAGKSSILQAVALFFSGSALPKTHFFDEGKEIRIEITFSGIVDDDINRLAVEHREKIRGIVDGGLLTLARLYGTDGKSKLKYRKLLPSDVRFSAERVDALVKGKKSGGPFLKAVVDLFPELDGVATATMNQSEIKERIQVLADSLPPDQKTLSDADLPTGIDKSIDAMLPRPIYIQAVKDLKDDVKTAESSPFGKILGLLLTAIEPKLADDKARFSELNKKLNRVVLEDGTIKDDRLPEVRKIEETVQGYVQESFANVGVKITIPPPELKTVLSAAQIYADDGVEGLIESKGDGLRRAIVFAILRSYVELSKSGALASADGGVEGRYLLLFEEPELFLHPKAQQVLFDTLSAFSTKHPVMVTTHSPTFFGPHGTTTFIKLRKTIDNTVSARPFTLAHAVELDGAGAGDVRDQFQIICYENNNIACFADKVVLVEGDSDYIIFPHLASIINPQWDCNLLPVRFARIGGKGNIRRYKRFFERFNMRVFVIADLDFLLGTEFGQIDPTDLVKNSRAELLEATDGIINKNGGVPEPTAKCVERAHGKGDLRALWKRVRELRAEYKNGRVEWDAVAEAVDDFFAWEKYWARRDTLKSCVDGTLLPIKRKLLAQLRSLGVCVLEKGAIEDYYPNAIVGDTKPSKAQCFRNTVLVRNQAIALCASNLQGHNGAICTEFEAIFETIFND